MYYNHYNHTCYNLFIGKFKPTVLLDKSRAGRSHGVLYKGITDAESGSDSDEEITQGLHGLPSGEQLTRGLFGSATGQDAGDLLFKDQEKFMFAKSAVVPNGNSIQNYNKRKFKIIGWVLWPINRCFFSFSYLDISVHRHRYDFLEQEIHF